MLIEFGNFEKVVQGVERFVSVLVVLLEEVVEVKSIELAESDLFTLVQRLAKDILPNYVKPPISYLSQSVGYLVEFFHPLLGVERHQVSNIVLNVVEPLLDLLQAVPFETGRLHSAVTEETS